MPVQSVRQPLISPTICSGITGLLVGIGLGVGLGAVIFNRPYSNGIGGGVWFGKRRKRSDGDYGFINVTIFSFVLII